MQHTITSSCSSQRVSAIWNPDDAHPQQVGPYLQTERNDECWPANDLAAKFRLSLSQFIYSRRDDAKRRSDEWNRRVNLEWHEVWPCVADRHHCPECEEGGQIRRNSAAEHAPGQPMRPTLKRSVINTRWPAIHSHTRAFTTHAITLIHWRLAYALAERWRHRGWAIN